MPYHSRANLDIRSFVVGGARDREGYILTTDATPYEKGTVLAQVATTGKLVAFTDETAVDGTAHPKFLLRDYVDASGGDVDDVGVYEIGEFYNFGIAIRNSKTLDTKITIATGYVLTVRQALQQMGIIIREDIAGDGPENA